MWVTEADRKAHPRDLNIFGGLPYDARYDNEIKHEMKPFEDPFPNQMKVAMGRSQRTLAAGEPDWRAESGLRFILWHTRNILCGGESPAFVYLMQWFAFCIQKRKKPSTMPVFCGAPGVGKSALVSVNESNLGILPLIYGGKDLYFQTVPTVDHLLKDFNADNMNKLFCTIEEARRGKRNHDHLGLLISNAVLRIEHKGIDPIHVDDHRAFCCCTNNRDAFHIDPGDRRYVLLEADDRYSQKAVKEGRCAIETRMEYMTKLSENINDEVAYEFYKLCMEMDISAYKPQAFMETELHKEQQSQNECALKSFLQAAQSGEYQID